MQREFTGKHMLATMVIGFGIVIAVNFTMAYYATSGFGGVIVKNSYVASQKFNGWLEEAEKQEALGWTANLSRRADDRLAIATEVVPQDAEITAEARRVLGKAEPVEMAFAPAAEGGFVSDSHVAPGRWIVRVTITHGGNSWSQESRIS